MNRKSYFAILCLVPSLLSILLLLAIIKGDNPRVSNVLYLLSGISNAIGFAGIVSNHKPMQKKRY